MKITYLGHASFHMEAAGKHLIVDPFISANKLAADIDVLNLKADYLLLTHAHQDHILDVETIAGNNPQVLLISNYEIVTHYAELGLSGHPMNHGGHKDFDFGSIKFVNAVHSSTFPDGKYGGNPGGFVLFSEGKTVYLAGDTALTMDMKLLPLTCPPLDMAVLPIGDNFTMGYKDAAIAADFVKCNQILGCHYNTFEPISIDTERALEHFKSKGMTLHLPEIGEGITL